MQIFSMYLISGYYPYTILKNLTIFIFCHLRLPPIHTTCCTFSHVSIIFPAELYDCPITTIFTRSQRLFWNQHEPFFVQFCHILILFFIHLISCLLLLCNPCIGCHDQRTSHCIFHTCRLSCHNSSPVI